MIKFFRKIRQRLIIENKFSKYLLYAIGEIILIVLGILIALQMNNWNETRKQNIKRDNYLSSLLVNLNENVSYLKRRSTEIKADLKATQDIGDRIGSATATIDTITKIAREEISLDYYAFTQLNDNTYQTLQSTGHIEYLERWLQEELQKLNFMHKQLLNANEKFATLYIRVLTDFLKIYPLNKNDRIISEQLADLVLEDISNADKMSTLNSLLSVKQEAYGGVLGREELLEEKMIWLADTLMIEYPFLKN